jgi:hypothetical protein
MDDFAANIDGSPESFESDFDDVDGANDASAETTWFQQKDPLRAGGILSSCTVGDGIERSFSHNTIISIEGFARVIGLSCSPAHHASCPGSSNRVEVEEPPWKAQ